MSLTPRARFALAAIAAALLVAGLAGPIKRGFEAREVAAKRAALAEQIARERAQATEVFKANRPQIIENMRAHLARSEYIEVLRIAAPYGHIDDDELRELYREAGRIESQRQRAAQYAALVERDCNEGNARDALARIFAAVGNGNVPPAAPSELTRLPVPEARPIVLARLRDPLPDEHKRGSQAAGKPPAAVAPPAAPRDWVAGMREAHRARILPDYLGFLLSPNADAVICVWRAQGERVDGGGKRAYTLDLWLAPQPDLKALGSDVATYAERAL